MLSVLGPVFWNLRSRPDILSFDILDLNVLQSIFWAGYHRVYIFDRDIQGLIFWAWISYDLYFVNSRTDI